METSQPPDAEAELLAIIQDMEHNLEYAMSEAKAIWEGNILAGSTTDDNIHMYLPKQKRLKTQLNQSEHTALPTPAVPKEKTLAQVEMKIAGAEKTDMLRNEGIPTRKSKTQKQKQTKGSGRSKNLPLRSNLHSSMALPVLPDVSDEGAPIRPVGSNLLSLGGSSNIFEAAASEERRLREGLATEKVALEKVLLAKAQGIEQELVGMLEKHTQLKSELEALSAEHGRLKDAALSACAFALSGSSTRETPTSMIIEGLKNLPDRLATVIKNEAFNVVRDAFAVARSHYDSTDLTKIGEGLAVAGDPHRPELEEITETVGPVAANLPKASDALNLLT